MAHYNERGELCYCRFNKTLPTVHAAGAGNWEPGEYGKGLYWPATDHLVIWNDERHHYDIESEDRHYEAGPAIHLEVEPDGTVRGEDTDTKGLEHALKAFDPHLKLSPYTWTIHNEPGHPTEPTPEWPSKKPEDEKNYHNVQVSDGRVGM